MSGRNMENAHREAHRPLHVLRALRHSACCLHRRSGEFGRMGAGKCHTCFVGTQVAVDGAERYGTLGVDVHACQLKCLAHCGRNLVVAVGIAFHIAAQPWEVSLIEVYNTKALRL